MDTAKIFNDGDVQVSESPEHHYFDCEDVYIKKTSEGVLLISKEDSIWDIWEKNFNKYDELFMIDRNQPEPQ